MEGGDTTGHEPRAPTGDRAPPEFDAGCAPKTGEDQRLEVSYDEVVSTRIDPAPCVVSREASGKAWARELAGQPSNRERAKRSADVVGVSGSGVTTQVGCSQGRI